MASTDFPEFTRRQILHYQKMFKQLSIRSASCLEHGDFLNGNSSTKLEMWANAQRDGRPAEYRWRPLFNAAKFG